MTYEIMGTILDLLIKAAIIAVLVYLAILIKNLVETIKKSNVLLDDAQLLVEDIQEKSEKLNGLFNVFEAISGFFGSSFTTTGLGLAKTRNRKKNKKKKTSKGE